MTKKSLSRRERDRQQKPQAKPMDWQIFFTGVIAKIRKAFGGPVRVTIVVRRNETDGIAALYGDDDIDQVIADMQAKRNLFLDAQKAELGKRTAAEALGNG